MNIDKPSRKIKRVIIHCSADSNPRADITHMGLVARQRGQKHAPYHYFIKTDGVLQTGISLEQSVRSVRSWFLNRHSISVCVNGFNLDDFTTSQFIMLQRLCKHFNSMYPYELIFKGHIEFAKKACPVFDFKKILKLDDKGRMKLAINRNLS